MGAERTNEIEAAASEWLIRRESGAWSAADQACMETWLNASTLNRVAFLRLELAWEDAARLKALGAGIAGDRPPPPGQWNVSPFFDSRPTDDTDQDSVLQHERDRARLEFEESPSIKAPEIGSTLAESVTLTKTATEPEIDNSETGVTVGADNVWSRSLASERPSAVLYTERQRPVRRPRFYAAAATVLVILSVGGYVALAPGGDRFSTPVGGLASVPMADGSNVTLNTDSQIRIALSKSERDVDLRHGEAFFEVSKDPTRPFVVRVGHKRVVAVGTKFSVRREGNDLEVVVTEGKVRLEDAREGLISLTGGTGDVYLTPGSIARVGESGVLVQRKTLPEAEEQLSWRTGVLMFRNQSLQEAIAEFNRYNLRKIVIQDPVVASLKIEGNFRATNAEAFVRLLESGFAVRAQIDRDQIVLVAK